MSANTRGRRRGRGRLSTRRGRATDGCMQTRATACGRHICAPPPSVMPLMRDTCGHEAHDVLSCLFEAASGVVESAPPPGCGRCAPLAWGYSWSSLCEAASLPSVRAGTRHSPCRGQPRPMPAATAQTHFAHPRDIRHLALIILVRNVDAFCAPAGHTPGTYRATC